jgi:hypothetical protein
MPTALTPPSWPAIAIETASTSEKPFFAVLGIKDSSTQGQVKQHGLDEGFPVYNRSPLIHWYSIDNNLTVPLRVPHYEAARQNDDRADPAAKGAQCHHTPTSPDRTVIIVPEPQHRGQGTGDQHVAGQFQASGQGRQVGRRPAWPVSPLGRTPSLRDRSRMLPGLPSWRA